MKTPYSNYYYTYAVCRLEKKWNNGTIHDWSKVLNQLMINKFFTSRIEKYLK